MRKKRCHKLWNRSTKEASVQYDLLVAKERTELGKKKLARKIVQWQHRRYRELKRGWRRIEVHLAAPMRRRNDYRSPSRKADEAIARGRAEKAERRVLERKIEKHDKDLLGTFLPIQNLRRIAREIP